MHSLPAIFYLLELGISKIKRIVNIKLSYRQNSSAPEHVCQQILSTVYKRTGSKLWRYEILSFKSFIREKTNFKINAAI